MQSSNKAVLAAVAAALASFIATVQGRPELDTMRAIDWIIVVLSAVVAGISVYAIPNQPTGRRRGEPGESWVGVAVGLAAVCVVIYILAVLIR